MITCDLCPLGVVEAGCDAPKMVFGRGPLLTAKIVVVMSAPSSQDQRLGRLLSGHDGRVLEECLVNAGINPDEVYFTSFMKHVRSGGKAYTKSMKAACKPYILSELESAAEAKVIVLMGSLPVAEFTGVKKVTSVRGREITVDGKVFMPTFDPASFLYNPANRDILESDLKAAKELSVGKKRLSTTDVHDILTIEDFDAFLDKANAAKWISFDIETNGLSYVDHEITDLSFSIEEGESYVLPWISFDPDTLAAENVAPASLRRAVLHWFKSGTTNIVTHGGLFDWHFLIGKGYVDHADVVRMWSMDTLYFRHFTITEDGPFRLEYLAGIDTSMAAWDLVKLEYERILGKGSVWRMPDVERRLYAGGDSDATLRLANIYLQQALDTWPEGVELYYRITHPMLPPMAEALTRGLNVDVSRLNELRSMYSSAYETAVANIRGYVGPDVLLSSDQQLVKAMQETLGIQWPALRPNPKNSKRLLNAWFYTNTQAPSIREEVRNELSKLSPHPIWTDVGALKGYGKLLSTYTGWTDEDPESSKRKSMAQRINQTTGRIYTNLLPHGTVTGRRSSSSPNLQNIPNKDAGSLLRTIFIPSPGNVFLSCDLDQAEIVVAANISQDPIMLAAISNPGFDGKPDFHRVTASFIFGKREEDITQDERSIAKTISFGTLYGGGPNMLATRCNVDLTAAKEFIDNFYNTYSVFRRWQREQIAMINEVGYVSTLYGRRRRFRWPELPPELADQLVFKNAGVEREAMNSPIQGTVADHIASLWPVVREALLPYDGFIVLEIHDELLAEVPEERSEEALPVMVSAMTKVMPKIGEIIPVSGKITRRWKDSH